MILKEKSQTGSASVKHDAGIKQEQDVAFYLRRAYKDRDNVMVLNDISLSYGGETAQIDHLIVYSYGFIVVESKSIRGEVKVNKYGEWTRSYKDSWNGMPSPIKQAELQIKLLQELNGHQAIHVSERCRKPGGEDGCSDAVNPGYAGPHSNKGKHIQGAVT